MIQNILRWIAVVLALIVVALSVLYLNRSDPYFSIPGKQLQGEEVPGPIEDWSFTLQHRGVTNEVRPSDPYSVNTSSLLVDEVLYIPSGKGGESRWAQFLLQDPNMRLRVGTKIYKVRATHVEEPAQLKKVREAYGKKYPRSTPEAIAGFWFFQMDSR
jgi:hypothetical protein